MCNKTMIILSRKLHHNERVKNLFSIKYDSHIAKGTNNCFVEEDLR